MIQRNLKDKFKQAGVELKILDKPIGNASTSDIVQMNVGRSFGSGGRRNEWIEIYPGHEDNTVQVRGIDKKRHQVVLLVMEPAREFTTDSLMVGSSKYTKKKALTEARQIHGGKLVTVDRASRFSNWSAIIKRMSTKNARTFLMGLDERQLFISQTTSPVTTVDEAHKSLGNVVQVHNAKRKGSAADRQGEWFFLETTAEERRWINEAIRSNAVAVHRKVSIGAGGNPHTADEMVDIPASVQHKLEHGWPVRRNMRFIKGCVRHVDHKTVRFPHWRLVISNNEQGGQGFSSGGNYFID